MTSQYPRYDQLGGEGLPPGANWGVFGEDDELGTLNFITEACVRRAAGLVTSGTVYPLGLPHNYFVPPLSPHRKNAIHTLMPMVGAFDDKYDDFFPQAASQWDALRHVSHPKYGGYNGAPASAIGSDNDTLSISRIARRGVVTRGVLLDVAASRAVRGTPIDPTTDEVITVADMAACLDDQNVALEQGDMVLLRTGWLSHWRATNGSRPAADRVRFPGLSNDPSMAAFLWDHRIAAIAGDNNALEAAPGPGGRSLHVQLIAYLGMPIGEFWDFDALAAACEADGRYEFLFTAAPMDLPGGCGSPANALAIK